MKDSTGQPLTSISAIVIVAAGVAGWLWQPVRAESPFSPAYFQPGNPPRLTMFPLEGMEVTVALPPGLPTNMRAIAFSADGRAIFGQKTEPLNRSNGIYKVEFQPTRTEVVPGSVGMGESSCVTISQASEKIIVVAGWSWRYNKKGIFEIDPEAATSRLLPTDSASRCGGVGGVISPDGKQVVTNTEKQLGMLYLGTGAVQAIKGTSRDTRCVWSPDSQWVACIRDRRIALINSDDASRPRDLGAAGDAPLEWSPDSRYLLLRSSPVSCAPTFYGESLEILDVVTGERTPIWSSHCKITAGTLGWMDRSIVQ